MNLFYLYLSIFLEIGFDVNKGEKSVHVVWLKLHKYSRFAVTANLFGACLRLIVEEDLIHFKVTTLLTITPLLV